jgi:predicted ATPase/class 3 adenylate cyclase
VDDRPRVTTFLFTDIEGSTRLWEQEPERMRAALAGHDTLAREAVTAHRGVLVKTTGDGIHAAFDDPRDAVAAALALQRALADPQTTGGLPLRVRCGLNAGVIERRDGDYFGSAVNRAARIMAIAHGGQTLASQAVADLVRGQLPPEATLRDLGLVRLRDLSGAERVFQLAHPALGADFPPLRSLESTPNNLPQQLTTFVGREREQAEVHALLRTTRLLTLSGTGGLGKTRLALQVAADALGEHPDGVWFIDLAPITDARLLPQAVASVLSVKEDAGRPVRESLLAFVRERSLLLILDNCEHLVDACAQFALQVLQSGPKPRLLVTSRESLRVPAETSYPVPALAFPATGDQPETGALLRYEAVRLFVERASAVQPAFRLTERNASAVVEICRQLDGIPLALELAAARTRALSVETIAVRMGDLFRRLPTGDRTALPRQQTLRALIDWSHDLLAPPEQALFRRLAVFAGGWTIEAAEAVCAGGEVARDDVLDLLSALVDKSLVAVEHGTARYRLLETVRRYAAERLHGSGEEEALHTRHLEFFVAFAERDGPGLVGPAQQDLLPRFDADRENILAAHAHCVTSPALAPTGYRLVPAIKYYWFIRGLLNLGHRVSAEVIALPAPDAAGLPRCRALWVGGQIASAMGRYDEARQYLEEGLGLAREANEPRMVMSILNTLSLAALGQGERDAARTHGHEALELAERLQNVRGITVAANALAQIHRLAGELDAAEPLYARTVALAKELGDQNAVAVGELNLAMLAIARGADESARRRLLEVLRIAQETGSMPAGQSVLEVSSGLAARRHEWVNAARFFGAAERQTGHTGIRRDPADEAFLHPLLAQTRAALDEGAFARAAESGRALGYDDAIALVRAWLTGALPDG